MRLCLWLQVTDVILNHMQCPYSALLCAGLTEKEIRRLINDLIGEMAKRGMRISSMFKHVRACVL